MSAVRLRDLSALSAVLIVMGVSLPAQARHSVHHHHHLQDSYGGGGAPVRSDGGGFAVPTGQMIRVCDEQAAELQKMRIDPVIETVQPSDAQRAALQQIGTAAIDASNKLRASCPRDVPAKLTERLDTMRASLDAIKIALLPLRPVFVSAYAGLDDEQKARLVVLSVSKPSAPQPSSPAKGASQGADNQVQPITLDCQQWPAMLKSWPVHRIESELSLSDEQHAALYTLVAAEYRAAASLAGSCHEDNALTPVARLDAELAQVATLHQSIDAIEPVLAGFVDGLNDEQNMHLNTLLGAAPQPVRTAR